MVQNSLRPVRSIVLVFVLVNALFITGRSWLERKGIDQEVVIIGNLVLFAVTILSFFLTRRSLRSANPNVFIRAMYGSFIIKFFVIVIAAFVYIMVTKENVNKPALFACMGLYVVYTFLEVSTLVRLLKQTKNA